MAAIVRIKRRRDEDPQDLLLLSCKKIKSGTVVIQEDSDNLKTVVKFAGTVSSKDDAVSKPVREAIRKEKLEREFKQHQVNLYGGIRQQTRHEQRQSSQKSRYKVISSHRGLNLDSLDDIELKDKKEKEAKYIKSESLVTTCNMCGKTINSVQDISSDEHNKHCLCKSVNEEKASLETGKVHDKTDGAKGNKLLDKKCIDKLEKLGSEKTLETVCSSVEDRKVYCLVDVETDMPSYQSVLKQSASDQITCNEEPMKRELVSERGSDEDYVYDLYFINKHDFDFRMLDDGLTLEAFTQDNIYTGGLSDDEEFIYEDEDDENDENNWRNDYPDEDPGFLENSDDEEFYGQGLQEVHAFDSGQSNQLAEWMSWRCNIEDRNELSSDDDEVERYERGPAYSSPYYRHAPQRETEGDSDEGTDLPDL